MNNKPARTMSQMMDELFGMNTDPDVIFVRVKNPQDQVYQFNVPGLAAIFGVAASALELSYIPGIGAYIRPQKPMVREDISGLWVLPPYDDKSTPTAVRIRTDKATFEKMQQARPDLIMKTSTEGPFQLR